MVSRNNFQQNRAMQQQRSQSVRAAIAPYKKPFRPQMGMGMVGNQLGGGNQMRGGNQMMYSSSQMPSDPLYIDFNKPTPPTNVQQQQQSTQNTSAGDGLQNKKKQLKGKSPKGKQLQQHFNAQYGGGNGGNKGGSMNMNGGVGNNWQPKQRFQPPNRFNGGGSGGGGGFNRVQMGGPPNRGGRNMMSPMGMGPMGPHGGGPMPPFPPMPFQPQMPSMRGPMPPMGGGGPMPHFMRRNGRGAGPGPGPMPPMMGPHIGMGIGPRMPPRGMPLNGPPPFNMGGPGNMGVMHMNGNTNGGKIKKPNAKLVKQAVKGKSTIKTLKNLVNQYPIDKPWVTDEIRAEHAIKTDIEKRLQGHKDDELFAQFKVQRDKFVSLYEAAREEYLKQEAASVMAKDAKDKDKNANSNQNAAAKVGNTKDATIPKTIKTDLNTKAKQQQQNKAEN
ncbi:DNA-binding protein K10 [Scaptodrosophila lebanonensis]|uniref:DNA-binding protein K10 n=1 Tax=Drosophila lebanonensis TaxID=7225 RepID=A0A6J2TWW0_DROLE|nr:DNA-binding protein K10 [Scaptodrosophila lebanonensis]